MGETVATPCTLFSKVGCSMADGGDMTTSREADDSLGNRSGGVSCWFSEIIAQCHLFSLVFDREPIVDIVRFLEEPLSWSIPRSSRGGDSISVSDICIAQGTIGRGKQGADTSSRI